MAFISLSEELTKKSATLVENKFITKYLPELDPMSVKVYLFALYLARNAQNGYSSEDFIKKLNIDESELYGYLDYLEEFELIKVTSRTPLEFKILDCENYYGKPKKLHPEKYDGLYEEIQDIISGREVSQNEFMDYLILIEEYGFDRSALLKIINNCAFKKGNDISANYIKKVAKSFYAEGVVTDMQVEEKLSKYNGASELLSSVFKALSLKRRPEVDDEEALQGWLNLGFSGEAIIAAAKTFKVKRLDKLDGVIKELYNNKKFDVKEICDFGKAKDTLYEAAISIAKSLGIYISDPTPYVETYVGVWCGYGFSPASLKQIASYCFLSGRNSFDAMNDFVTQLYNGAYVDDDSVENMLASLAEEDKFIKEVLSACGLTRKIISYDRQALARWRGWGFNDEMILKAAELSAGKSNPVAAMNYLLSQWKNGGIVTVEQIPAGGYVKKNGGKNVTEGWLSTYQKIINDVK